MPCQLKYILRAWLPVLTLLIAPVCRADAIPPSYTLTDLGAIPSAIFASGARPTLDESGNVTFQQGTPKLSPLAGNGMTPNGDQEAYVIANNVKQWLGPFDHGAAYSITVANAGDPSLLVGSAQLASPINSSLHPAEYTPQTGWVVLPGILNDPGQAYAVNVEKQIVGTVNFFYPGSGGTHFGNLAFLSQDGTTFDLNNLIPSSSGWTLQSATDISNTGKIVGIGVLDSDPNTPRAFLLTPDAQAVPEPSTLAFFGLAGVAFILRRAS